MKNYKCLLQVAVSAVFVIAAFAQAQTGVGNPRTQQIISNPQNLAQIVRQKLSGGALALLNADRQSLAFHAQQYHLAAIDGANPLAHVLIKSSGSRASLSTIPGLQVQAQIGNILTAELPIAALPALAALPEVTAVSIAKKLQPENDLARAEAKVEQVWDRVAGTPPVFKRYGGKNVIVGVIDTGIDWDHGDFIDDATGHSRILSIWDQTLAPGAGESNPAGYSYGVEYTRAEIDDEIDGSPVGFVRTRDTDGHGTHVAGIAAGDGSETGDPTYAPAYTFTGMAPEADIIVVKYGNGFEDVVADGISYIFAKAAALGLPAVINISSGTHFGAHDGTSLLEQAIDGAVGTGKVIVKSAGNSGTDVAHAEYIHAEGTVSVGSTATVEFTVPAYVQASGAGNDYALLTMWYQGGDNLTVTVERPNGRTVSAATGSAVGSYNSNGYVAIFNADAGLDPNNGDHECNIELWDPIAGYGPAPGVWKVRVTGNSVTESGHFDVWIAAASLGLNGLETFFTSGWEDDELVSIPGTARNGLTVGAYSTKKTFDSQDGHTYSYTSAVVGDLAYFSSYGTREDLAGGIVPDQKPEICGAGFGVVSTLSTDSPYVGTQSQIRDLTHLILAGTSMSSPHVAGLVALLLQQNPNHTADDIKNLLTQNARQDGFTGSVPNLRWGYGKAEVFAAAGGAVPPSAIGDLTARRGSMHLSWSAVSSDTSGEREYVDHYTIYRSTEPFFTPTDVDSIGASTGTSFVDTTPGVTGDVNIQYYYAVLAVDDFGNKSQTSNRVGEYDFSLVAPPGKANNFVTLVFENSGITMASQLADSVGVADLVSRWNPNVQAWGSYIPGLAFTDFPLIPGEPYMVSVTRDTTLTQVGNVLNGKTFDLIAPPGKANNAVTVPLDRTDLTLASQLAADIGSEVDLVSRWNPNVQAWGSYVPGLGFTDFPIYPGMPLLVSVTAPVTWPSSKPLAKATPVIRERKTHLGKSK